MHEDAPLYIKTQEAPHWASVKESDEEFKHIETQNLDKNASKKE